MHEIWKCFPWEKPWELATLIKQQKTRMCSNVCWWRLHHIGRLLQLFSTFPLNIHTSWAINRLSIGRKIFPCSLLHQSSFLSSETLKSLSCLLFLKGTKVLFIPRGFSRVDLKPRVIGCDSWALPRVTSLLRYAHPVLSLIPWWLRIFPAVFVILNKVQMQRRHQTNA